MFFRKLFFQKYDYMKNYHYLRNINLRLYEEIINYCGCLVPVRDDDC